MNYVLFNAGEKEYKLRLNTQNTINLENKIGCNPVAIFGNGDTIPKVTVMIQILHASLQQYEHGIALADTYNIWDTWLNDGHEMSEFIPIIIDIYKVSGLIKNDKTQKN